MLKGTAADKRNRTQTENMTVRWKPRCPYCGRPLMFVYDEDARGIVSPKCENCHRKSFVDLYKRLSYVTT